MSIKNKFTRILKEKTALARQGATVLTSGEVADGCGAIIKNTLNEYGYDLRLTEEKGLLPPWHPVRLAFDLEQKHSLGQKVAHDKSLTSFPLIQRLAEELALPFVKLTKNSPQKEFPVLNPFNHPAFLGASQTSLLIENFHYSNSQSLLPAIARGRSYSRLGVKLDPQTTLLFSKEEETIETEPTNGSFYLAYLDFLEKILINDGSGRISAIESILMAEAKNSWEIVGCYIFIKQESDKEPLKKSDFHQEGLLVSDKNFFSEKIVINMPVSVFDWQIKEIVKKIKSLTERKSLCTF